MMIIDTEQNRILDVKYLGKVPPSAIKFSPNGDLLIVGFTSG